MRMCCILARGVCHVDACMCIRRRAWLCFAAPVLYIMWCVRCDGIHCLAHLPHLPSQPARSGCVEGVGVRGVKFPSTAPR